jgi:hypothetical protein
VLVEVVAQGIAAGSVQGCGGRGELKPSGLKGVLREEAAIIELSRERIVTWIGRG